MVDEAIRVVTSRNKGGVAVVEEEKEDKDKDKPHIF